MPRHKPTRKQRETKDLEGRIAARRRKIARNGRLNVMIMPMFIVSGGLFFIKGVFADTFLAIVGLLALGLAAMAFGVFFLVSTLLWPPWKEPTATIIIEGLKRQGKI